jgi:hypothetical protein
MLSTVRHADIGKICMSLGAGRAPVTVKCRAVELVSKEKSSLYIRYLLVLACCGLLVGGQHTKKDTELLSVIVVVVVILTKNTTYCVLRKTSEIYSTNQSIYSTLL